MALDPATKELIERLRQERDDARRDAAFARQVAEAGGSAATAAEPFSRLCPEHGDLCGGSACCCADLHAEPFSRSPRGSIDAAAPPPPKLCAQRHPDGERWCYGPDGHVEGAHTYPPPRELPRSEHMPREAPR